MGRKKERSTLAFEQGILHARVWTGKNGTQACKKMPAPSLPNPHPISYRLDGDACVEPARAVKASAAGSLFLARFEPLLLPAPLNVSRGERGDAGFSRTVYAQTRKDRPATLARSAGRSTRGLLTHRDRERRGERSNGRRGCLLLPLYPFFLRFFP